MTALDKYLRIEGVGPRLGDMSPSSLTRLQLYHEVVYPFKFGVGFVLECNYVIG